MGKIVIFSEKFHLALEELTEILFEKKYFSFRKDCFNYTSKIYDFVENNIDLPIVKNSPEKFQKFGKQYLKYKANQHTFWYVFFEQKDSQFLVNYILNNHSKDFPELM